VKTVLSGVVVAAFAAFALPAWSQTGPAATQPEANHHQGLHENSNAGVPGLPGGKSGKTVTPSGSTLPEARSGTSRDQSGVKGLPGNKSGPAVAPSKAGR
jgi:hypothetical protein